MSNPTMPKEVPCTLMRGGTSKGLFFLRDQVPSDQAERDAFLLRVMGSPDPRQIDGAGGADPLTSKVAFVSRSTRPDVDVDYLFLQVFVDKPLVSTSQNCGNILAGVAQFALENGLVKATSPTTDVRIYMENVDQTATARVQTPNGIVTYAGDARIDGVPGTAAPVALSFDDAAGSMCGSLLPTGNAMDVVNGVEVTLIDNGMPVVVMRASDFGITGYESREELEANTELREKIETLRLAVGPMMNLGDVTEKSVPKMTLVSPPTHGGCINTRSFIPHRCHASLGVFAALSVATACLLPESPAYAMAVMQDGEEKNLPIEHPTGAVDVAMTVKTGPDGRPTVTRSALVRTARKIMSGSVFTE